MIMFPEPKTTFFGSEFNLTLNVCRVLPQSVNQKDAKLIWSNQGARLGRLLEKVINSYFFKAFTNYIFMNLYIKSII